LKRISQHCLDEVVAGLQTCFAVVACISNVSVCHVAEARCCAFGKVVENFAQVADFERDIDVWNVVAQRVFMGVERFEFLQHFSRSWDDDVVFKRLGGFVHIAMCEGGLDSACKLAC
jgi:hypothetical protein